MRSNDDGVWPVHSLMLAFHDLRGLPLGRPLLAFSVVRFSICCSSFMSMFRVDHLSAIHCWSGTHDAIVKMCAKPVTTEDSEETRS